MSWKSRWWLLERGDGREILFTVRGSCCRTSRICQIFITGSRHLDKLDQLVSENPRKFRIHWVNNTRWKPEWQGARRDSWVIPSCDHSYEFLKRSHSFRSCGCKKSENLTPSLTRENVMWCSRGLDAPFFCLCFTIFALNPCILLKSYPIFMISSLKKS